MINEFKSLLKYLLISLVLFTTVNSLYAATTMVAPQIVIDSSGNATSVWLNMTDTETDVMSAYKPVGESWGSGVVISSLNAPYFSNLQIQIDSSGNVVAGWMGIDSNFQVFSIYSNTWDASTLTWVGAEQVSELGVAVEGNFTLGISGGEAQAVWSLVSASNVLLFTNNAFLGSWSGSPVTLP
jgi:hypothetical protein